MYIVYSMYICMYIVCVFYIDTLKNKTTSCSQELYSFDVRLVNVPAGGRGEVLEEVLYVKTCRYKTVKKTV